MHILSQCHIIPIALKIDDDREKPILESIIHISIQYPRRVLCDGTDAISTFVG